jgi:phage-related protein
MPVKEYLDNLTAEDRAICAYDLAKMEKCNGPNEIASQGVAARQIEGKLWEIKTGLGRQQRIFYVIIHGPQVVLLHAGKKQKQKAEKNDKNLAIKRMQEVLL